MPCEKYFIIIVVYKLNVTGCLNGGGQIKPIPGEDPKEKLSEVELAYQSTRYANNSHKNYFFHCM